MKKIALISLSALIIIGLSAYQTPKKAKKATKVTAPKETPKAKVVTSDKAYDVKFDKTYHDFGKATEGELVETIYVLTNLGKEPVLIKSHEVQCGCTTPSYSKEPIMPGKSTNVTVGFNTNGKMGINEKTVKLTTNGDVHELKFKCEVTPKAAVDPIVPAGTQMKIKTN